MTYEALPNINEPILFGPKSFNISHRWWKWLQRFSAKLVWQAPVLGANITNVGGVWNPAGYCIDGLGRVWLRGLVKGTGLVSGATIFTLPAGFIPPFNYAFSVFGQSSVSTGIWGIDVSSTGAVTIDAAAPVGTTGNPTVQLYLDGISFLTY